MTFADVLQGVSVSTVLVMTGIGTYLLAAGIAAWIRRRARDRSIDLMLAVGAYNFLYAWALCYTLAKRAAELSGRHGDTAWLVVHPIRLTVVLPPLLAMIWIAMLLLPPYRRFVLMFGLFSTAGVVITYRQWAEPILLRAYDMLDAALR